MENNSAPEPLVPTHDNSLPFVLGVDDIDANLKALKVLLRGLSINLVTATSGAEAIEAAKKYTFSLVLMDIQMPGMSGFEAAKVLRNMPQCANVPLMYMTAHEIDEVSSIDGYDNTNAIELLTKPINRDLFRSKVTILLDLFKNNNELHKMNKDLKDELTSVGLNVNRT